MCRFSESKLLIVLLLTISYMEFGSPQLLRQLLRTNPQQFPPKTALPITCSHNSIIFYQDCRLCVCPRPNRVAKCYKKSCDLRTKDTGQCPTSVLRLEDGGMCPVDHAPTCRIDNDCPGAQLCCFDFCGGARCADPFPLDVITGQPLHKGRAYN